MAKLSANGVEVGTIYTLRAAKRYMSNGVVLKNIGFGWKRHGKLKAGFTPEQAYALALENQTKALAARPAFAAYRKELHSMTGLCNRWKLHTAVELMPDDCDGVWSEACDGYGDNVSADVDEVGNLCRLYLNAMAESDSVKAEKEPAT